MTGETVFAAGCGIIAGTLCTVAELVRPARPVSYRRVVLRDAVAFAIYIGAVVPAAIYVVQHLVPHTHLRPMLDGWPLAVRLVLYYLAADLGSYLFHRLMHTRLLWRVHKWHHAPTYMYWFAGVRATIPQQLLFNLPGLLAIPILGGVPAWVAQFLLVEQICRNDWMHMNVSWRSNWLEWLIVTPRYHHIHHSTRHHGNYGSLFTLWDRLFGSRIDPDHVGELEFGTGEEDHPVRVVIGV